MSKTSYICSCDVIHEDIVNDVKSKMQRMVENMTNGTVEFETEVDADIMGGFVLEYDTYRMDASVKNRLREILQQLKN